MIDSIKSSDFNFLKNELQTKRYTNQPSNKQCFQIKRYNNI